MLLEFLLYKTLHCSNRNYYLTFFSFSFFSNSPGPTPAHLLPLPTCVTKKEPEEKTEKSLKRKLLEATLGDNGNGSGVSAVVKRLVYEAV